jgi:hypothetical protein
MFMYIYNKKKHTTGVITGNASQNRLAVVYDDYSPKYDYIKLKGKRKVNCVQISEADWKWITGARSKMWKRNKTAWDKYQIQRAQKIIASL